MKKIRPIIFILSFLLSGHLFAQKLVVNGKITSGTEPLVGASVVEKGTQNGSISDVDGNYELSVSSRNATLVISFVGYRTQEIAVAGKKNLDLVLESADELSELIVVGYGTQKKAVVTGAIAKVKASDLENMPVQRIEQSLQGRASGVLVTTNSGAPGAAAVVRIRGTTTINDANPLYVVDGLPITGGIDYLGQSDIESIEVLKDAASASVYGARAANGVILVTTKKGRVGRMDVNYNAYYGQPKAWKRQSLLNAREYATIMNEGSVAGGGSILFARPDTLGVGTDWQDAVFNKEAYIQNHEISVATGTTKSQYYASFGYFDQTGSVATNSNSRYQRFNSRFNSTHKLSDYVTFGNTLAYTKIFASSVDENSEYGSPLSRAVNIDPITPVIERNPKVLNSDVFKNFKVVRDDNGEPYGISNLVTSEVLNPVAASKVAQGFGFGDKLAATVFLEIEPMKGLKFRSAYGADFGYYGGEGFRSIYYLNAANRSDVTKYNRDENHAVYQIWENSVSFVKKIKEHSFAILAAYNAERNDGKVNAGSVQNIPVDNIKDASLSFPVAQVDQTFGGYEFRDRLTSILGRVTYDFGSKYLFSAVVRRDGSSKFGSNNLYGYFPSVSAGWVLTEEGFLKGNNSINFLKLRGSWGVNGNNKIGDFRYVSTIGGGRYYTFGTNDVLTNGSSPNGLANPDLRWEETSQTNFGFDAKLFRDFSLTVDYFVKKTTGMLLFVGVPGYSGNGGFDGNIAALENKGLEVELGYRKKFGGFALEFNGNIANIINKITDLGPEKKFTTGQTFSPQGLEITRTIVGYPIGSFYGYQTDGIFQNQGEVSNYKNGKSELIQPDAKPGDFKFKDLNGDGKIDADDRTVIGNPTPNWTYGFNLNLSYKNFDILFFGQGVWGNQTFKANRRFDIQTANLTSDALTRWTGEGTSTTYPRIVFGDPNRNFSRSSNFYVEDGAYFRVKTLQLGYTLPIDLTSRVGIRKLRFYVSGNNLLTVTKYSGFDPEIGGNSFGVDRGIYPQPRFFLFGVNVGI